MKTINRFTAAVMALAMVSAIAPMSAFAITEKDIDTTTGKATGTMTATYDVTAKYTVTIPPSAVIADTEAAATAQPIKAENVLLASGEKVVVTLSGASNTTTANSTIFNAKNGDSTVKYTIKAGSDTVALGGKVAEFESKAEEQKVDMKFIKDSTSTPTVAGTHTETLTFGIAVENAVNNPYAANNIGDVVTFGSYNWYIIGKSDNGVTLLMKENLTTKGYNDSYASVTWETCSLRTYLNGDFYNSFSADDKAKIVKTSITNPNNPDYSTNGGNNTEDYIYLLSIDEANALSDTIRANSSGSWWWLRSPGYYSDCAAFVYEGGFVITLGNNVDIEYGVRPALNLEF